MNSTVGFFDRCCRVLSECKTKGQLASAIQYCRLALRTNHIDKEDFQRLHLVYKRLSKERCGI